MPNWAEVLKNSTLESYGKSCTTLQDFADCFSTDLGEPVTVDSLFSAFRRHKEKLKLKSSLTEYINHNIVKPKVINPDDIRFDISTTLRKSLRTKKKFIITSALNNVGVDTKVWDTINVYSEANNAGIIVIPARYKNPTTRGEEQECVYQAWWPSEVTEYMVDEEFALHEHLRIMANVRVQATAINPLTGLETLSRGSSAIFGHAQLAMKTVPTPQNKIPKVIYTTGSTSIPWYSDSKAGILGDFHHTRGALIVELDGSKFHIRAVTADKSGCFYDLDKHYSPKGVKPSGRALALITGDEHAMFADKKCKQATYTNKDSIASVLKPEKIVRHDLLDAYTISHHTRKDPVSNYAKHKYNKCYIKDELDLTLEHVHETTPKDTTNVIVASNHHDHLLRWLKEVHAPVDEPWNVDVWLELWTLVVKSVGFQEKGITHRDPFEIWMSSRAEVPIKFLKRDSDMEIGDTLVGYHGDQGTNGSRGSVNQFSKIGAKTVLGHRHSPSIKFRAYQVGTSSLLKLEYTKGPSNWAHCHCIIYPNGQRQLIFVIDGKWRKTKNK